MFEIFIPNTTFKGGQWLLTSELSIISERGIVVVNVTKITNKQADVERSCLLSEKLVVKVNWLNCRMTYTSLGKMMNFMASGAEKFIFGVASKFERDEKGRIYCIRPFLYQCCGHETMFSDSYSTI